MAPDVTPFTPGPLKPNKNKRKQKRPNQNLSPKPEKLQENSKVKMDIKLIKAVQTPDSKFDVEQFQISNQNQLSKFTKIDGKNILKIKTKPDDRLQKLQFINIDDEENDNELEEDDDVVADAMGSTGADVPINDVNINAYFPESNPNDAEATLVLEPMSKAIAGNYGKSISVPISHATLRKGTSVKLLYRPHSVALAGVGGVAHAGSDLIIDFIE